MSNMSYCRFTNTLADLRDCWEHMDEDGLSEAEQKARRKLIRLCDTIAEDYADEVMP